MGETAIDNEMVRVTVQVDGDRAQRIRLLDDTTNAAAENQDEDDHESSISDLSDGFNASGSTLDFEGDSNRKRKDSKILRYKSIRKWKDTDLTEHMDDMEEEMRRLSHSFNT